MLPFLFFTSRSKRVSFCPHTWQVKVNGIFASRAIKTRHAGSALKKGSITKALRQLREMPPSPVTNIVSIGHAAIFHNGKMRLFAAPCHFPSCYAASQGGPHRLFFLCKARKRRQNVLGSPSGEFPEGVVQANWIFRSEATRKSSETPFRAKGDEGAT